MGGGGVITCCALRAHDHAQGLGGGVGGGGGVITCCALCTGFHAFRVAGTGSNITFGFNVEKKTEAHHTRTYRRSDQGARDVARHGCSGYAHGKTKASSNTRARKPPIRHHLRYWIRWEKQRVFSCKQAPYP